MTANTGDNKFGVSTWIVCDPDRPWEGTHTTLTAALAVASSGDSVWIKPGLTLTENVTVPAGVAIAAFPGGEGNANVIINGKLDGSAGTCTLANLTFQTNSDVIYDVSGTTVNQTSFTNCTFFLADGDGITLDNANANPKFINCGFRQSGSDFDLYNITSCGTITFSHCDMTNTGAIVGVSDIASGTARFRFSRMQPQQFTTSGSGIINAHHSAFICDSDNLTPITTEGTGTSTFSECRFESGTASTISVGTGTTVEVANSSVRSTNANPLTGAGTVVYSGIDFISTGNGIDTNTATGRKTRSGSFSVENLTIEESTISSTNTDGDIDLIPDGIGKVIVAAGNSSRPGVAFDGDEDTGMSGAGDVLSFIVGGVRQTYMNSGTVQTTPNVFRVGSGDGPYLLNTPTGSDAHYGFGSDRDTGMRREGADNLAIITAGNVGLDIDADGNVTVATGNLILGPEATQIQMNGGAATDFIGQATLASGTATVLNTNIAASDRIFLSRADPNSSSALGMLSVTAQTASTSFVITALDPADGSGTIAGDTSIVNYIIIREN
jgi:hypothetical protein